MLASKFLRNSGRIECLIAKARRSSSPSTCPGDGHTASFSSASAVAVAYLEFRTELLALAVRFLANHDDAEDVIQDVFARVLMGNGNASRPLLRKAVTNASLNLIRFESRFRRNIEVSELPVSSTERADAGLLVEEYLRRLSARQRQILRLRMEGYTYQEIAERLSLSYETVHTHLNRAKRSLRRGSISSSVS
jgi:RNA polymerase sigma factor (sigma-70 family)